ncbi:MAG TPA: nucleoside:proton symporter [Desulfobacteraceae bacterium]|nr:nucleoside:proton symporter [Deltaproteobacteria bacterium]HDI59512.1 nucleoside:proton symporter [Desulfobacteraceae bacterium]
MILQSALGVVAFCALAWAMSENRSKVKPRVVLVGLGIQAVLALVLLKMPFCRDLFMVLNRVVAALQEATGAGTSFVFGYLGGGELPFEETYPGAGFVLAFQSLPLVMVVSALSALLFYWRILPLLVRLFAGALQKTMGIGGAEGVGVAANVFVGMVEAPLLVRPYLARMTRSELFSLMTSGMATIAGTVMVIYASLLSEVLPDAMGHILTASIISVPAAVMVAKIMVPETRPVTPGTVSDPEPATSAMDAVTRGTLQGVELLINIVAMLVVLVALVHLFNLFLQWLPAVGGETLSLQRLLGWLLAPAAWLMGVPWSEAPSAGALMGTKTILNEFIAYMNLSRLEPGVLSPRATLIMTYAMCGFANPGSLGIMIGGLGTMAPGRRREIVALGLRSIVGGTLATCLTGCIVGLLIF